MYSNPAWIAQIGKKLAWPVVQNPAWETIIITFSFFCQIWITMKELTGLV